MAKTKSKKRTKPKARTKSDINVRFFTPEHYKKVQAAASKTFEDGRSISMNRYIVKAVMAAAERTLSAANDGPAAVVEASRDVAAP